MLSWSIRVMVVLFIVVSSACSAREPGSPVRGRPDSGMPGGASGEDGGATVTVDSGAPAFVDPFDPDSACGASAIPTVQVPGSLLLVFDRSGSMDDKPDDSRDDSRWEIATRGINDALAGLPDDLNMGLMMFPAPGNFLDGCAVDTDPQVPVGPLATTRPAIARQLRTDPGGGTPAVDALRQGWAHLETLDTTGQKGVILVTDGGEGCKQDQLDAVHDEAEELRRTKGILTYAVGLNQANNFLSELAIRGGTARDETCIGECTSRACLSTAECPGAASCFQPIDGELGVCGCTEDAECIDPQRCVSFPILGGQCLGDADCCHYNARGNNFESEFRATLARIAERFLDSCVFQVPKGDEFDPAEVNVGVTFEGEERDTLPFGDDASVNSWRYVDDGYGSLVIQGPICQELLMNPATVEIVVGCPTIII